MPFLTISTPWGDQSFKLVPLGRDLPPANWPAIVEHVNGLAAENQRLREAVEKNIIDDEALTHEVARLEHQNQRLREVWMTSEEREAVSQLVRSCELVLLAYEDDDLIPSSDRVRGSIREIMTGVRDATKQTERIVFGDS